MRIDPWNQHRFSSLDNLSDYRAFIEEGKNSNLEFIHNGNTKENATVCMVYEMVGDIDGLNNSFSQFFSRIWNQFGWNQQCWVMNYGLDNLELAFNWEDSSSEGWLNPTGLSGRSDRIFDTSGIRIHWLEIR